ncbi:right-handed parallel beta-helix repeat-containing protein [Synechococcus sp. Cruz CV-v-12]|uniref:right-handed parallel beta-helix repeat-containing protein n=1 Tax=Synechococcus sp. Cruz CV-v-12 TaxID=2823728 RepID=UPI0020CE0786|nr:right-handed parallel beta-helix repeat-containing protein [Synechococcus sp. Cruz CV-v-12]MCP9874366.1 hypothetical protein [Synechococcus sp. Cruz CV-v-12]
MKATNIFCTAIGAFGMLASVTVLHAGPLTPPVGPVAPTAKPLSEVEPRIAINATNTPGDLNSQYRINSPGSYYFTGDQAGVLSKWGIFIAADDVTIDLNGFTFRAGASTRAAITYAPGITSVRTTIKNGTLTGWGLGCISLNTGSGAGLQSIIENVRIASITGRGIDVGEHSIIRNCNIDSTTTESIFAFGSLIESCVVRSSGSTAIQASNRSIVRDCRVTNSVTGISVSTGSIVRDCLSSTNSGTGFSIDGGSSIIGCTAVNNVGDGIILGNASLALKNVCQGNGAGAGIGAGIRTFSSTIDCRIEGNTLTANDRGLNIEGSGSVIIRNFASGNTTVNWQIAVGNAYGAIVATPAGAAVSGNTAAAALGSTDPNANFTY